MCGIVGYIGKNDINKQLLDGLKKLEYRGYDSAGIAVLEDGKIKTTKSAGRIANLENFITPSESTCGIGHTRWATHGKPTAENAHPHTSSNGEWAVVHNGIIENYIELKDNLVNTNKVQFKSQSDSEVIPQMLAVSHESDKMKSLIEVCKSFQGSFAIACINKNEENTIYLAKKKSGLYIAKAGNEVFVASDPSCFVGKSKEYFILEDDEFCRATNLNIEFFDINGQIIHKSPEVLEALEDEVSFYAVGNYMLKEILETPTVLKRIVNTYKNENIFNKIDKQILKSVNKIYIIGCGTAYHSGLLGERFLQKFAHIETRCFIASEFRYSSPILDEHTLCIFVSQSGETADTLACFDYVEKQSAATLAITNVLYSSLARQAKFVLPVLAGPEVAVASTKAYSAQSLIFLLFAKFCQNIFNDKNEDIFASATEFVNTYKVPDVSELEELKNAIKNKKELTILGRDLDYITAQESALKIKEVTYINCVAFPSGELKHGYIALIDHDSVVISIATEKSLFLKSMNANHEVICRGAKVFLFSQFAQESKEFKQIILPSQEEEFMPIVTAIYFQLLSFVLCKAKGLDPDKPRNLAKSVTVE